MSAMDSTLRGSLADRAKEITQRELATYAERTAGSQKANARARKVLPLGVPSSFQAYDPYPVVIASADGSKMFDVDGNEYTDFDMGFGALFVGHRHPQCWLQCSSSLVKERCSLTHVRPMPM
jgi:glutamate-1-semialdehyde 2,1-aminomutase